MPEPVKNLQQKLDNFLTNYLRKTTTDQEILDFYGEGNVVGRKGIPANDKELLDAAEAANKLTASSLRPSLNRPNFAVGGIDQSIGYDYKTTNMPGVINPATGQPWQMTFGVLPKDFGSSSLTPAAKQFLFDFRVLENAGNDYSFATGPNIQDRINYETNYEIRNDPYYGKQPERLQEKLDKIQNQSDYIGDYSGNPQTPRTWQERGYITDKPANFKEEVLKNFKNKIFETQGPFGGVSTLTPVRESNARNPNWRADLYQTEGLAGPLSNQGYNTGYGFESKNVQRFTTGSERLLPLQPYTEFYQHDPTPASALATKPAEDFTPFQKAVGTRNYLIGRNVLAGRGSLGAPVRAVRAAPRVAVSSVKPATKALLLDAGINYALGASPQEAIVTAVTDPISAENLGGAPTAAIERLGPRGEFVDTRSNTVLNPQGRYTNQGIAYKNGKPVIVPRGSVAGEGNFATQAQAVLGNAINTWKKRLSALGMFGR
jgi:hypothetical protein